jgi:hypothetical protein
MINQSVVTTCTACLNTYNMPASAALGDYPHLCAGCFSRDTLREYDRIESARRYVLAGAPQTLTLAEWLAIVASWRGLCALCGLVPFSQLSIWIPAEGLAAHNVVPLCKACSHHKLHSWRDAMERVDVQLTAIAQEEYNAVQYEA